jgi:ABC-2 type transporter
MALKPALASLNALIALRWQLNRNGWLLHVTQGLLVPLLTVAVLGAQAGASPRMIAGGAFFSACFVIVRAPAARLVSERWFGVSKLLLGTANLTPSIYCCAYVIESSALIVLPAATILTGALILGVPLPSSPIWLLPFLAMMIWLQALGLCLSGLNTGPRTLYLITDLATAAMIAFCPVFYGLQNVPGTIRPLISHLAPGAGMEAIVNAWTGAGDVALPSLILLVWIAVTIAAARFLRPFRG